MINFYRNEIEFGSGDVCIFMSGEAGRGRLVFRNQEPQPIGVFKNPAPDEEVLFIEGGDIIMSFSNPQSVDAVIRSLQTIKDLAFKDAS